MYHHFWKQGFISSKFIPLDFWEVTSSINTVQRFYHRWSSFGHRVVVSETVSVQLRTLGAFVKGDSKQMTIGKVLVYEWFSCGYSYKML